MSANRHSSPKEVPAKLNPRAQPIYPPHTLWFVCRSVNTPQLHTSLHLPDGTATLGFFLPDTYDIGHSTVIECTTHSQTKARQEMQRVANVQANVQANRFPANIHQLVTPDEIKLYRTSQALPVDYLGKVYVNDPMQLT